MFGNFGIGRYLNMREEAKDLPEIAVSRDEFIRLMLESGEKGDHVEFFADICNKMGSSTRIGDQMVKIKS